MQSSRGKPKSENAQSVEAGLAARALGHIHVKRVDDRRRLAQLAEKSLPIMMQFRLDIRTCTNRSYPRHAELALLLDVGLALGPGRLQVRQEAAVTQVQQVLCGWPRLGAGGLFGVAVGETAP